MQVALRQLHATISKTLAQSIAPTFENTVTPVLTTVAHYDRLNNMRDIWTYGDLDIPVNDL